MSKGRVRGAPETAGASGSHVREGRVVPRCLICRRPFRENGAVPGFAVSRQVAYDPARGRLWGICEACHGWTLCPIDERSDALYNLERIVRDTACLVAGTANVSLLQVKDTRIVRVGAAGLAEQAWWRYGRELRRRKAAFDSPGSRLAAYTMAALHAAAGVVGLADEDLTIGWDAQPVADVLRWRRFGWAAWHGRARCPYCNSALRALRYDLSWWVYPLRGEDDRIEVGVPCSRCDPWTPDNVYRLRGPEAVDALRRCLAYQNIGGAGEALIRNAARAIEETGSGTAFALEAAERRQSLWKMGPAATLALEVALGESAERRSLDMEARALEARWRHEEELARIIDEELTPPFPPHKG